MNTCFSGIIPPDRWYADREAKARAKLRAQRIKSRNIAMQQTLTRLRRQHWEALHGTEKAILYYQSERRNAIAQFPQIEAELTRYEQAHRQSMPKAA